MSAGSARPSTSEAWREARSAARASTAGYLSSGGGASAPGPSGRVISTESTHRPCFQPTAGNTPAGWKPQEWLEHLAWQSAIDCYDGFVPDKVLAALREEFALIDERGSSPDAVDDVRRLWHRFHDYLEAVPDPEIFEVIADWSA